jgi:hypothetical protein
MNRRGRVHQPLEGYSWDVGSEALGGVNFGCPWVVPVEMAREVLSGDTHLARRAHFFIVRAILWFARRVTP